MAAGAEQRTSAGRMMMALMRCRVRLVDEASEVSLCRVLPHSLGESVAGPVDDGTLLLVHYAAVDIGHVSRGNPVVVGMGGDARFLLSSAVMSPRSMASTYPPTISETASVVWARKTLTLSSGVVMTGPEADSVSAGG